MKKTAFAIISLFLLANIAFAKSEHASDALKHAQAAVTEGQAKKPEALVEHALTAIDHTLAGAIDTKGITKNHLDAAGEELEQAINHGRLKHSEEATQHAQNAVEHIQNAIQASKSK